MARAATFPATASNLVTKALALHQQGDLTAAEALYQQALALQPRHADALHLLGMLKASYGELAAGIALIQRAIAVNPSYSPFHNNLGSLLLRSGALAEAEQSLQHAIRIDPTNVDAQLNLGRLLEMQHRPEQARNAYQRALDKAPRSLEGHMSLGRLEEANNNLAAASACFRRAISIAPTYAPAYLMSGRVEQAAGNLIACETNLLRAVALDPTYADAFYNLGHAYRTQGRLPQAAEAYQKAIALAPHQTADAYNNLGVTLDEMGQPRAALNALLQAVTLNPSCDEAFFNMGRVALKAGDDRAAEPLFQKAITLNPGNAAAHHDLGALYHARGLLGAAAISYRSALAGASHNSSAIRSNLADVLTMQGDPAGPQLFRQLVHEQPGSAEAHWNLGLSILSHRLCEEGWREFEHRRYVKRLRFNYREAAVPWHGEPLHGKTLLLEAEQGFGDTLQFVRYLPLLLDRGMRVVLSVQPALHRLLSQLPGLAECVLLGDTATHFDRYLPLMSLPLIFNTTSETIPPPLCPPPQSTAPAPQSVRRDRLRVGLLWAGNPSHQRDKLRSLPHSALAPLLKLQEIDFTCLQFNAEVSEIKAQHAGFAFVRDLSQAKDFADTAAIIRDLDLVITVDTAVAHLASGMGKPVWILLSNCPDWRWGLTEATTPWYPSARLFRQPHQGGWSSVTQNVLTELHGTIASRRAEVRAQL